MSLMYEFDTFMSEKIKPDFEAGKIKDIEKIHDRLSRFLKKWIDKNTEKISYGVNDELFLLKEVMDRLNLLEKLFRVGCNTLSEYTALWDITVERIDKETDWLYEILKKFNEKFPNEAVDLEG